MDQNSNRHVVNNVFWSGVDKFSAQFVQLVTTIIIARVISPEEFGLVAMITVFLYLAQILVDSGFCTALIQKQDCNDKDYSTVFSFNLLLSVLVYGVLFVSAPSIAKFYDQPELVALTRYVGINIIVSALSYVQRTILTISMQLKKQAKISFISVFIGAIVGIVLAYKGYGAWSLVMLTLVTNISSTILLWVCTVWRPTVFFSTRSFKRLAPFGFGILLSSLLQALYTNMYTLVIGKVYAAMNVGYFNRVQTMLNLLSNNIMNIIDRPVYAFQCKNQNDKEETRKIFIIYLRFSSFIIFPIMFGGYVLAEPLIVTLLTVKWLPAVPIFKILAIASLFVPISFVNANILKVLGKSQIFFKSEIIKRILGVVILFLSIKGSLSMVCYGLVLYNLCDLIISVFYARRVIEVSWIEQFMNLLPIILLSMAMGLCIYIGIILISSLWLKLCIGIFIGLIVYSFFAIIFKFKEIQYIKSYLKTR